MAIAPPLTAHLRTGRRDRAKALLSQLSAQGNPEWARDLEAWAARIAQMGPGVASNDDPGAPSGTIAVIDRPIWAHGTRIQPSSWPGRISRWTPLFLAEEAQLGTDGDVWALIPRVSNGGFAVFGGEAEDSELCRFLHVGDLAIDSLVAVTLITGESRWSLSLRLIRVAGGVRLAEEHVDFEPQECGHAVVDLARRATELLAEHVNLRLRKRPDWCAVPNGPAASEYLLRIEQLLAAALSAKDALGGELTGKHEMLSGALKLSATHPDSPLARIVLADMLRRIRAIRPEVLTPCKEKVQALQRTYPLSGQVGDLVSKTIDEALA